MEAEVKKTGPDLSDIQFMQQQLRELDLNWAEKLAVKMNINADKVRNITRGIVSGPALRVDFINKGFELKEELEKRNLDAVEKVQELKNEIESQ